MLRTESYDIGILNISFKTGSANTHYHFLIKSADSFYKSSWYSKASSLNSTIRRKMGFLFARLLC